MTWTVDCGLWTRSPNLRLRLRYRTLREEAREVGEGGSFIDTGSLFYAINTYSNYALHKNGVKQNSKHKQKA